MATVEILNSSESAEWYTPARYIAAVREVLGDIELDPASCADANETVKAKRYFTIEDDGLRQPWAAATLFLNPPYGWHEGKQGGVSNQKIWSEKMMAEFSGGVSARPSCSSLPPPVRAGSSPCGVMAYVSAITASSSMLRRWERPRATQREVHSFTSAMTLQGLRECLAGLAE
jgi:hypothetical protein